jgi:monoamine oxidase
MYTFRIRDLSVYTNVAYKRDGLHSTVEYCKKFSVENVDTIKQTSNKSNVSVYKIGTRYSNLVLFLKENITTVERNRHTLDIRIKLRNLRRNNYGCNKSSSGFKRDKRPK